MSESPFISIATQDNFVDRVIEKSKQVPVLVDFWADWCAPCKNLMPILAKLANEYAGAFHLVKVNTDEQQALAMHFGVRSLPTVKLFRDGQAIDEFMGALPEQEVRKFLDRHVRDDVEVFLEQIDALIESGDRTQAEGVLTNALEQLPGDARILTRLAMLRLDDGDIEGAKTYFEQLPDDKKDGPEGKRLKASLDLVERVGDAPDEAALRAAIENDPGDSKSRDLLASVLYARGDIEEALEQLLEIVIRDREYDDDGGRRQMIQIFEALGSANPQVKIYRRRLGGLILN